MRFSPNGKTDQFMYTGCNPDCDWPSFGSSGDLEINIGRKYVGPGTISTRAGQCGGGICAGDSSSTPTFSGGPNEICGGNHNWGETDLEVWRLLADPPTQKHLKTEDSMATTAETAAAVEPSSSLFVPGPAPSISCDNFFDDYCHVPREQGQEACHACRIPSPPVGCATCKKTCDGSCTDGCQCCSMLQKRSWCEQKPQADVVALAPRVNCTRLGNKVCYEGAQMEVRAPHACPPKLPLN